MAITISREGHSIVPGSAHRAGAGGSGREVTGHRFEQCSIARDHAPKADSDAYRLAEEQAALRRVATLVARGTPQEQVFAAVIDEVVRLLGADLAVMGRYGSDATVTSVARSGGSGDQLAVGSRWELGGRNLGTIVFETGRPARIDGDADTLSGSLGSAVRKTGIRSSVATPITVEGRLWGVIVAGSTAQQPLPPETEARLAGFTELVATAIANAESRAELARLAGQQAALRRVATLVARGTPPEELLAAVIDEVIHLFSVDYAGMARYEPDGMVTAVAARGTTHFPVGSSLILGGKNTATRVFETGRPAPATSERRGQNPVRQLAQLELSLLGMRHRLVHELARVRVAIRERALRVRARVKALLPVADQD